MSEQSAVLVEPQGEHKASVIWLHGLGADGNDFLPVVEQMALADDMGIRWIFPNAPEMAVTVNNGYKMPAWFDIAHPDLNAQPDLDGMRASRDRLLGLMLNEMKNGVPAERIVLAGFSQGGVIALAAAMAAPVKPAGVIALSTYLPLRDDAQPGEVPVFMAHGEIDNIVPLSAAEDARAYLQTQGYPVTWEQYPMPHTVCAEEIDALKTWLVARLSA